jgi:hypothetical protein
MAVSGQHFCVVFASSTKPWRLEHIPSPFSNSRNIVIKQPVGDYPFLALLRPLLDMVNMSRHCVGSVWSHNPWSSHGTGQQIHPYPLEFPVGNDHTEIRSRSCCWLYDRYQASLRDSLLRVSPRRGWSIFSLRVVGISFYASRIDREESWHSRWRNKYCHHTKEH